MPFCSYFVFSLSGSCPAPPEGTFHVKDERRVGTFDTAIEKLPYLQELGINAVEIMPVAEFPGDFSWGCNPAHPFAVEIVYGGPDGLKRFVKAAHQHGIAARHRQVDAPPCVIIDEANKIVYLHGRTGRYLEPVIGKVSVKIPEMMRPGLKMDLVAAIRGAATNEQECVTCCRTSA